MKGCMSVVRLLYLTGSLLMKELSHSVGDRFLFFQVIYSISFSLGSLSPKQKGQSFLLLFGVLWVFFFFGHASCGIFVPQTGIEPVPLVLEAWNLNYWTVREVLVRSPTDSRLETMANFGVLA